MGTIVRTLMVVVACSACSAAAHKDEARTKGLVLERLLDNIEQYAALWQELPDTASHERYLLKILMENDMGKVVIASKNESIRQWQKVNATRWGIGNIGFFIVMVTGYWTFVRRPKRPRVWSAVFVITLLLYLAVFNMIPELIPIPDAGFIKPDLSGCFNERLGLPRCYCVNANEGNTLSGVVLFPGTCRTRVWRQRPRIKTFRSDQRRMGACT
jgi:hypothetical protein